MLSKQILTDTGLELSVEEGGKEGLIICCILVHLPGVRLGKWVVVDRGTEHDVVDHTEELDNRGRHELEI